MSQCSTDEKKLIEQLRKEASDVKSCFTTFSFQAITFSAAILGLIFGALKDAPLAVFAAVPVIILLMIVCRIGIFKYTTANRILGYELHLSRMDSLLANEDIDDDVKKKIRKLKGLKWEEAQKAWRVVQTTLFRAIYNTTETSRPTRWLERRMILRWLNHLFPFQFQPNKATNKIVDQFKSNIRTDMVSDSYPWFMPKLLTASIVTTKRQFRKPKIEIIYNYHAGHYLRDMLGILVLLQYLLLSPIVMQLYKYRPESLLEIGYMWHIAVACSVLLFFTIIGRHKRVHRRRNILENEMLSIHSCAILWQVVALAHYEAMNMTDGRYAHYTEHLVKVANRIKNNHVYSIHNWLLS